VMVLIVSLYLVRRSLTTYVNRCYERQFLRRRSLIVARRRRPGTNSFVDRTNTYGELSARADNKHRRRRPRVHRERFTFLGPRHGGTVSMRDAVKHVKRPAGLVKRACTSECERSVMRDTGSKYATTTVGVSHPSMM